MFSLHKEYLFFKKVLNFLTPLSIENIKLTEEANTKLVNNTLRPLLLKCVGEFRKVKKKAGRGFVDAECNQPFQRILL